MSYLVLPTDMLAVHWLRNIKIYIKFKLRYPTKTNRSFPINVSRKQIVNAYFRLV